MNSSSIDRTGPPSPAVGQANPSAVLVCALLATGTRITFTIPDEAPAIDFDQVMAQVEIWRAARPGLTIDISVEE